MRIGLGLVLTALSMAAACAPTTLPDDTGAARFIPELPEAVVAAAAPYQDLTAVELRPGDGCYWYRHIGPVETTFLPLRTRDGRPICTRPPAPPAPQLPAPIESSAG